MMGPWLVYASLLNGATIALYNGAPLGSGFAKFVQVDSASPSPELACCTPFSPFVESTCMLMFFSSYFLSVLILRFQILLSSIYGMTQDGWLCGCCLCVGNACSQRLTGAMFTDYMNLPGWVKFHVGQAMLKKHFTLSQGTKKDVLEKLWQPIATLEVLPIQTKKNSVREVN